MTTFNLEEYLTYWAKKTESWLRDNLLYYNEQTVGLTDSMRYSIMAGGKRLRPALIYSAFGIFDNDFDKIIPYASSVEMLHTYSLIHDDLPAMDDDDYRRGKPTNHKMFGEATAILSGDALLTKAFEIMLDPEINTDVDVALRAEAAHKLAVAAGDQGMVGGQYADIQAEKGNFDERTVEFIHKHKTASLLGYCTELGAIIGYGSEDDKKRLRKFGMNIGLAFQIVDDLLDLTSSTEEMGKDAGSDLKKGKATYPGIYGVDKSKLMAQELVDESLALVECYKPASRPLKEIASFVVNRKK